MSKRSDLNDAVKAWKKDIDSEPFNAGELERKANEQAKTQDEKK